MLTKSEFCVLKAVSIRRTTIIIIFMALVIEELENANAKNRHKLAFVT